MIQSRRAVLAHTQKSLAGLGILTMIFFSSCFNNGGLNTGQHQPGNEEDGVHLRFGDIAIDPGGTFFISRSYNRLLKGNIQGCEEAEVIDDIIRPVRMAFGKNSQIYVTSSEKGGRLTAYDAQTHSVLWKKSIDVEGSWISWDEGGYPYVEVSENGEMIVLTDLYGIRIVSSSDGKTLRNIDFDKLIIDVDLHPDGDRVIITLDHEWVSDSPRTEVVIFSISTGAKTSIEVPNCSDEMILEPSGKAMFLAPTNCQQDPVSVIDLRQNKFVRNLPGFGPVAMSPSGELAVAFMDMDNLDLELFGAEDEVPPQTDSRYRLMFFDVATLNFDTIEIGNSLPRYAMTPDGQVLLVDSATWFGDARIRLLDIPSRRLYKVAGPEVQLENFVITSDSERVFLLDSGLYDLSLPDRVLSSLPLTFTPENLNITPDDQTLLLRQNSSKIWVYDVQSGALSHSIKVDIEVEVDVDVDVDINFGKK